MEAPSERVQCIAGLHLVIGDRWLSGDRRRGWEWGFGWLRQGLQRGGKCRGGRQGVRVAFKRIGRALHWVLSLRVGSRRGAGGEQDKDENQAAPGAALRPVEWGYRRVIFLAFEQAQGEGSSAVRRMVVWAEPQVQASMVTSPRVRLPL